MFSCQLHKLQLIRDLYTSRTCWGKQQYSRCAGCDSFEHSSVRLFINQSLTFINNIIILPGTRGLCGWGLRCGWRLLAEIIKEVDTTGDEVREAEVEVETKQRTDQRDVNIFQNYFTADAHLCVCSCLCLLSSFLRGPGRVLYGFVGVDIFSVYHTWLDKTITKLTYREKTSLSSSSCLISAKETVFVNCEIFVKKDNFHLL